MSRLLQDWVVEAAEQRPDALAVVGSDESLTYTALDERSSRIATGLRAMGCREGDRVAVLMPKSALAVASIVGTLKAGCAYVPLDPGSAFTRTAHMIRQAEPMAILAAGDADEALEQLGVRKGLGGARVGWLGEGEPPPSSVLSADDLLQMDAAPPSLRIDDDDLAYILFTSGRTGQPKGVPVRHRNVRAFIDWVVDYFDLGPDDRLSGHTALTFDLSTFDIYATFAAGAQLHQVPERAMLHPHEVPRMIEERELTVWFSVPSQLSSVARYEALEGHELSSLRHVAWCGDVLPPPALRYWKRRVPGAAFTNLYGPTETTVASSYWRVPDHHDDEISDIPIGYACDGQELLLLDDQLRPVPDGEVGDIYIAGVGLADGYWRDPVKSAEVFVPDPRSDGTARICRTGDRGRRDENGAMRFLGRADFQIETSGYQVEPAEVENAVLRLAEIRACAVVPVKVNGFNGTTIGCGYVPSNGAPIRTSDLESRLGEGLPGYMIPSNWLVLDELPIDGRGKVDRGRVRSLFGGAE